MELVAIIVVLALVWWGVASYLKRRDEDERLRVAALNDAWERHVAREDAKFKRLEQQAIAKEPVVPASISGLVNNKPFFDRPYVPAWPYTPPPKPVVRSAPTIIYTPPPVVQSNSGPSFGSMVAANMVGDALYDGAKSLFNSAKEYVESVEPATPSWSSGGGGNFSGGGASSSWGDSSSSSSSSYDSGSSDSGSSYSSGD